MSFPVADGLELLTLPPPGQAFNPYNPQRHGDVAVYVVLGVGTLLASAFLAVRLYTCLCITKRIVAEDCGLSCPIANDYELERDTDFSPGFIRSHDGGFCECLQLEASPSIVLNAC